MKKLLASIASNKIIRQDVYDVVKVIAGVIAAKYGLKLA